MGKDVELNCIRLEKRKIKDKSDIGLRVEAPNRKTDEAGRNESGSF